MTAKSCLCNLNCSYSLILEEVRNGAPVCKGFYDKQCAIDDLRHSSVRVSNTFPSSSTHVAFSHISWEFFPYIPLSRFIIYFLAALKLYFRKSWNPSIILLGRLSGMDSFESIVIRAKWTPTASSSFIRGQLTFKLRLFYILQSNIQILHGPTKH